MALGGVGYFASNYWATQYWHEEYWAESGAVGEPGGPGAGTLMLLGVGT